MFKHNDSTPAYIDYLVDKYVKGGSGQAERCRMAERMANGIGKWREHLSDETVALAEELMEKARLESANGRVTYPPRECIFRALELTPPDEVKVVIVGQDPYHGDGEANGLAFSVNDGIKVPPSLRNIFKELRDDIGCDMPASGDLTPWAKQGVLLLNSVLTVEKDKANSHSSWGWQKVVLDVLRVCTELSQPIVFVLWGAQARAFTDELHISEHTAKTVITSSHPSPLGATKGNKIAPAFIGSRPFSKVNRWLESMGAEPVEWALE